MEHSRRREREEAVYLAALRLIEQGEDFSRVKVQQIADAAGIGKGTVYEYFSSKDEILAGLDRYCFDRELDRLDESVFLSKTLDELVQGIGTFLQDLCTNRASTYLLLVRTLSGSGMGCPTAEPVLPCWQRLLTSLTEVVRHLREDGQIDPALEEHFCIYTIFSAAMSCMVSLVGPTRSNPAAQQLVLKNTELLLQRSLAPRA